MRAGESCAVGDGARGGGVAIDAVGSSAENGDGLAGDFFDAGENEGGIATADSLPRDRTADFAVGDECDALAGIGAAEVFKLGEKIFGGAIEGPIVGCVIATGDEAVGFSGVMGGVIQTTNSVNVKQVPLLGDIPILGNLFKQRLVKTQTQELIFFITPKIIQT